MPYCFNCGANTDVYGGGDARIWYAGDKHYFEDTICTPCAEDLSDYGDEVVFLDDYDQPGY